MNKKYLSLRITFYFFAALALANCKKPFNPTLKANQSNFLVVEGYIDGAAPTTIKLSRTRMITTGDTATVQNVLNAFVYVEDDHNNRYPLSEAGNGLYTSNVILNLNPDYQFRLQINIPGDKNYLSDYVPYKQSPPVDSLGWKMKGEGIQIFVNTHDQNNDTRYYRWEYSETWEFHSIYNSELEYLPLTNEVVERTEDVHICWRTEDATRILLASTAKLVDDVIEQQLLVDIEPHSEKMSVLYSILVKQYALDINGYNYWEAMRNNTERFGSIFDPQPNQTRGNIHCINTPSEIVVGYIGAGASFENRYFIKNSDLPPRWNLYRYCEKRMIPKVRDSIEYYFRDGGYGPLSDQILFYYGSPIQCFDCTLFGTNIKPDFWP